MATIVEPYVKIKERVRETPTLLNIDGTANIGGVVVSPRGARYQYISGPKDFLEKLVGAEELPRDSHISLINAYYCSYFAGLVIARSLNTQAVSAIKIPVSVEGQTLKADGFKKVKFIGDTELNSSASISLDMADPNTVDEWKWAFQLNDVIFYGGTIDFLNQELSDCFSEFSSCTKVQCNSLYDVLNVINSWSGFNARFASEPTIEGGYGAVEILIDFNTPAGLKPSDLISQMNPAYDLSGNESSLSYISSSDSFKITADLELDSTADEIVKEEPTYLLIKLSETGAWNRYEVTLTPKNNQPVVDGEKQVGVSTLMIKIDDTKNYYEVSLNPNDRDSSGNNCFIDNLNGVMSDIQFELVGFDGIVWSDITKITVNLNEADGKFEDDGYSVKQSMNISALSSAVYELGEQMEFNIEYLSPFGITATAFLKDYIYVGAKNYWFTPVDIPFNYTTAAAIKIFSNGIPDSNNVLVGGPFDKNSTFLGWVTKIAFTSLYYERVFLNRANSSEWAPCFEETNGVLSYRQPYLKLGETDRVDLLNGPTGPADFVVFNQQNETYYLNDNRCHTTANNVMSEEMNRRMINKIKKDAVRIMNRFKGRVNTSSTREDVHALLKIYMDNNIMSQNYKPVEYQIQCDDKNNTVDVITANKLAVALRVRLLGSIKFVDVLVDIFPLGVDFEA